MYLIHTKLLLGELLTSFSNSSAVLGTSFSNCLSSAALISLSLQRIVFKSRTELRVCKTIPILAELKEKKGYKGPLFLCFLFCPSLVFLINGGRLVIFLILTNKIFHVRVFNVIKSDIKWRN